MGRFEGRRVLITGGARGQGRNHAVRFAREGADVAVLDIASTRIETVPYDIATPDDLEETVGLIEAEGRRGLAVQADVRSATETERAVARVIERFETIDVLVVNAGICTFGPIESMDESLWQTMLDVNLTGAFNSVRPVVPGMLENGYGRVIATSSMAGRAGWENIGHYAASKWGLIGMVKSLALEVANRGVTANIVCPSSVNTPMMHNEASYRLFRPDLEDPTMEDALPAFQSVNVLPVPYAETDDISDSVLFLASDEAKFITGATLSPSTGVNARNV
ncbi:MAG TPA: mycofactocin-coupled SDR family oxidoreductase [Solirubrobacterales bacterium]|nr:mycofactocin-coupled SDR family oxidoreductase [Solirubrobacterales bacterium]